MLLEALLLPLASYHVNPTRPFNETHPGVLVETSTGYTAGFYRNSLDKWTVLAGKRWAYYRRGDLDAGVLLAACTGYYAPVCGQLSFRYKYLDVGLAPKLGDYNVTTFTFVLRVPLR